jgi:hypothetical protein
LSGNDRNIGSESGSKVKREKLRRKLECGYSWKLEGVRTCRKWTGSGYLGMEIKKETFIRC